MEGLEQLAQDPRVTVRRTGPIDPEGQCVVYCVQRSQRAIDNPALDIAIEASDILKRPVVAFLGIVPFYPNANLRAYTFLAQGVSDLAESLAERGVGFVLRRHPDHSLIKFCEEVKPCLVVGDENPTREPERWRRVAAERLGLPFWTVDSDVVVPTKLMQKEHYAARTIQPHVHAHHTEAQLENAETHDRLWNAAQQQMIYDGWMHNYLRTYWGKKILEWTRSAAEAYEIAVRLNDRYELDGRDPKRGTHDQMMR
jgi:deoxyribodipyrimidine photo-lyase